MRNAKDLADSICTEYSASSDGFPSRGQYRLQVAVTASVCEPREAYEVTWAGGVLNVRSTSDLAAAQGCACVATALKAGHVSEALGNHEARHALRILWPVCDQAVSVGENLVLGVPSFLFEAFEACPSRSEAYCRRLVALGFNAVVVGHHPSRRLVNVQNGVDLDSFLRSLHGYGLRIILKPSWARVAEDNCVSPLNAIYRQRVLEAVSRLVGQRQKDMDLFMWQSLWEERSFFEGEEAEDVIGFDVMAAEMRLFEEALGDSVPLIYYLEKGSAADAGRQARWLQRLSQESKPTTVMAFSSVAGCSWQDHLPPHPLWQELRADPVPSKSWLPVVNVGGLRQGEGLWPTISLDVAEKYLCGQSHMRSGAICLTRSLPLSGTLLEGSLWVAGQLLWNPCSVQDVLRTWWKAHRGENIDTWLPLLVMARQLVVDLSRLRAAAEGDQSQLCSTEWYRAHATRLMSQLNELQLAVKEMAVPSRRSSRVPLEIYFSFFFRDAKRLLLYCLETLRAPLSNVLGGEELSDSFWTSMQANHSGGLSLGSVVLHEEAKRGKDHEVMARLFDETRAY